MCLFLLFLYRKKIKSVFDQNNTPISISFKKIFLYEILHNTCVPIYLLYYKSVSLNCKNKANSLSQAP